MRARTRPPVPLPTLVSGKGAKQAASHLRKKQADPDAKLEFPGHWNDADVRGALYAMHGRVCAYCEHDLPRNDRGDVEHFRPKSVYWWIAYAFENYLLSCSVCNRNLKGDRFPLAPGAAPVGYANRDQLPGEPRVLLDPVSDPVETWLRVDYQDDLNLCPFRATAAAPVGGELGRRVRETVLFYRLNLEPLLVQERVKTVTKATELLPRALNGDAAASEQVARMASRYEPHSLGVKGLLADLAPQLLPQPEQELRWLIQAFLEELRFVRDLLKRYPQDAKIKKLRKEILWALAVLWQYPPAGSAQSVEQLIQQDGWKRAVETYKKKLN